MSEHGFNVISQVVEKETVSEYETNITFRKQNFLFDFAKFYADHNTHVVHGLALNSPSGVSVQKKTYENFTILEAEDPSSIISNIQSHEGVQGLFGLKPYQIAALMPKIRLFKQNFFQEDPLKRDEELIFLDRINDQAYIPMTEPLSRRGGGVGLKKFEYVFDGKNPAETHMIRCKFELFFNNFADLTAPQADGASFIDLIKYSNKRKLEEANHDGSVTKGFNPEYFTIKAVLGWSVGTRTQDETIIPRELREAIESQLITLQLTLVKHDFSFGQDGTFRLTVDYYGMLEAGMSSPTTDVFLNEKVINLQEELDSLKTEARQVKKTITDIEDQEIKLLKQNGRDAEREDAFDSLRAKAGKTNNSRLYNDLLDGRGKQLRERRMEIEAELRKDKIEKYKRLLGSILEEQRIFRIELNKAQIKYYTALLKQPAYDIYDNRSSKELVSRGIVSINDIDPNLFPDELIKHWRELDNQAIGQFPPEPYKRDFDDEAQLTSIREAVGENAVKSHQDIEKHKSDPNHPAYKKAQNFIDGNRKRRDALFGTEGVKVGESLSIDYVYFGDILNSALSVISENAKIKDSLHKNLGYLVGDIPIITGNKFENNEFTKIKRQKINLADLPIALDHFMLWFIESVIKPQKTSYYLRDFISDILKYLLPSAMYDNSFEESAHKINVNVDLTLGMTTFSLPGTGFKGQERAIYHGERLENANILLRQRLQPIKSSLYVNKMQNWGIHDYLYLHANSWIPQDLEGEEESDFKKGIYHFYIGQDGGIMHEINFAKIDHKYQREALITQNGLSQLEYLREPYDANVRMLGNFLFYPGQLFYVNPGLGGFGNPIKKRSAARQIGLGGYYNVISVEGVITPEAFETEMKGRWVAFPNITDAELLDDFKTNPGLDTLSAILKKPWERSIKKSGFIKP